MTRAFVVVALALLPLSTVVAGPKVPNAGAAAPVTVAPEESMAAEVAAALAAPPVARTALSSRAELGGIVGVAEGYLSTPIVLSLSRQRVGNARLTVHNMWRNDPISGDILFRNDDSGLGWGASLTFEAIAGQTYVVECVGSLSTWVMTRRGLDPGALREIAQRVELDASVRPSLVFTADETALVLVSLTPRIPVGDARVLSRCQIAKVADVGAAQGGAKPVK